VLARAIGRFDDCESAFSHCHRLRSRRTARITRLSRWWGRTGLSTAPLLVWMRDRAYRVTPHSWFEWRMRDQHRYDAGRLE
jgi:2-polyprenyl-6-methoxyphenol hydroxylase-like FAD-dependent oxidoreductase